VVLSGGEPLLREDFVGIYLAAKRLGMIVTVFTNASLVTERLVGIFEEYPPHEVEVSVYGATEHTYERITGVPGSFARVRAGIDLMLDRGIRVGAKTMILRDNADEIGALDRLAHELGIGFRVDPLVSPRLDGHPGPLEQRVDPERVVEIEAGVAGFCEAMKRFHDEYVSDSVLAERSGAATGRRPLYLCGAGKASFHVDPQGWVRPCQMSPVAFESVAVGFEAAWRQVTLAIDGLTWEGTDGCADCPNIPLCGYCPGLFDLEGASPSRPPEYVCRLGQSRYGKFVRRERLETCGARLD
jgi:radical SAM protein with 4Fe4S-binding SPASM domain